MNLFTRSELNLHFELTDRNGLFAHALDVNFDAAHLFVVEGTMLKRSQVEVAAELAIDSGQHVQIKRSRNAERIVVCSLQHRLIFLKIRAEQ